MKIIKNIFLYIIYAILALIPGLFLGIFIDLILLIPFGFLNLVLLGLFFSIPIIIWYGILITLIEKNK